MKSVRKENLNEIHLYVPCTFHLIYLNLISLITIIIDNKKNIFFCVHKIGNILVISLSTLLILIQTIFSFSLTGTRLLPGRTMRLADSSTSERIRYTSHINTVQWFTVQFILTCFYLVHYTKCKSIRQLFHILDNYKLLLICQ